MRGVNRHIGEACVLENRSDAIVFPRDVIAARW
jgi:hypothetical protein